MVTRRRWYERFGIEAPFPWLLLGLCASGGVLLGCGILWAVLMFGGDRLAGW